MQTQYIYTYSHETSKNSESMKSYKMMAAAAASVLMLSGCGIYSTYKRPDSVAAPDSLYRLPDGEAASDTLSLVSLSWR